MDPIVQGLQVSLLGLLITFLALGVFILIMVGLQRLFPPTAEELAGEMSEEAEETPVVEVETADESEEGAVVAAIAAALNYYRASGRGQLGGSLVEGRSGWWNSRRAEARQGKIERRR